MALGPEFRLGAQRGDAVGIKAQHVGDIDQAADQVPDQAGGARACRPAACACSRFPVLQRSGRLHRAQHPMLQCADGPVLWR